MSIPSRRAKLLWQAQQVSKHPQAFEANSISPTQQLRSEVASDLETPPVSYWFGFLEYLMNSTRCAVPHLNESQLREASGLDQST
jgi:hypothetical protein